MCLRDLGTGKALFIALRTNVYSLRVLFGVLLARSRETFTIPGSTTSPSAALIETYSLCCEITGEPLRQPVLFGTRVVEGSAAQLRQRGAILYNPAAGELPTEPAPQHLLNLIRCSNGLLKNTPVFLVDTEIPTLISLHLDLQLAQAIKLANDNEMKIHAPLSLKSGVVSPAMTLDELSLNAVYMQRVICGNAGADMSFLRPCHGGDVAVDVNLVNIHFVDRELQIY